MVSRFCRSLMRERKKMTGVHVSEGKCPLCGGRLARQQTANIPFLLKNTVVIIKDVPADVCRSCHEPYMSGAVTDHVVALLQQLQSLYTEVSVVPFAAIAPQPHRA